MASKATLTRRKPRRPPKQTYTWLLSPEGMLCMISHDSYQTLTDLWETTALSVFHDAELATATRQVNKILSDLRRSNKDSTRTLSFIRFRNQHFLVWARYGAVTAMDDERTVVRELKLKMK
jgi:hypothetical protein